MRVCNASFSSFMASGLVRCQRIGCDCFYDPSSCSSSSTKGSNGATTTGKKKCVYHSKPPTFRDGEKLWPCCNKRSKDFNAFLSIEGCCEMDEHTQEKPPQPQQSGVVFRSTEGPPQREEAKHFDGGFTKDASKCPRCSNGFKCEDHPEESRKNEEKERMRREERKRIKKKEEEERMNADPNAEQTCTRAGCGMKFRESENTDTACRYHSGKPIFHERSKGWSCCASGKKAVYDFDEFLKIKTCKIGRHSSIAVEEEE